MIRTALKLSLGLLFNSQLAAAQSLEPIFNPLIFGGEEVVAGSELAQQNVFLEAKMMRVSFTCSAVVINEQVLMTASHCLGGNWWAEIMANFTLNKNKSNHRIKVIDRASVKWPLPSTPTDWDDIALLKLESPIPAGYKAAQIINGAELNAGDMVTMAGFGTSVNRADGNQTGSGILRSVEQNLLEIPYGVREARINIEGRGACFGDSGGPAYVKKDDKYYLLAIASRLTQKNKVKEGQGRNPAEYACLYDIVYGQVWPHFNWINSTLTGWGFKALE